MRFPLTSGINVNICFCLFLLTKLLIKYNFLTVIVVYLSLVMFTMYVFGMACNFINVWILLNWDWEYNSVLQNTT